MTKQAIPSIVVLISGEGTNLQAIMDAVQEGKIKGKISAVIANRADAYGLTRAKQAGIAAICLDHTQFPSRHEYDQALRQSIDQYAADVLVLAGFMRILTDDFVNAYRGRMLNVHPSLLPKYKGMHTHQQAIDAGDSEHGASIHFVTNELDGGPVIIQSKVPVFSDDDSSTLAQRVQQQERQIYPLVIQWFCDKRLKMENGKAYLDGNELPSNGYAAD